MFISNETTEVLYKYTILMWSEFSKLRCFCAEYDKLMAEGGTGDYFFIRFVLVIISLLHAQCRLV